MNNTNKLEDHIDLPMKKIVAGLSPLGFKTLFSCCGFSYQGEAVPKSHMPLKSYVFFENVNCPTLRSLLCFFVQKAGWVLSQVNDSVVELYYLGHSKDHPWAAANSPHRPEQNVLGINKLEAVINWLIEEHKDNEAFVSKQVVIQDGNARYSNELSIKYWQYPSCEPWTVTLEEYYKL